ncbi:MAG: DUF3307 domain-containing protein [Proteobacteria bacterium]|nr:DUF3307 domain-containing protein [Pseudomonadota bacterium]
MSEIAKEILICLLAAHFLGDFVFPGDSVAARKTRPLILFKHAFIVAASGYFFCGIWDLWQIPLVIFLTHSLMDHMKAKSKEESVCAFILDQGVHLAIIAAIVILIVTTKMIPINKPSTLWVEVLGKGFLKFLILVSGLAVSIKGGGILIGLAVKPFTDELKKEQERKNSDEALVSRGFERGGKIIGYLERGMIFLFILTGQPGSIGFLIAAKSIFRFGEIKERQNRLEAEYIIIGTLMSFGYGIFIAYATQFFLSKL